MKASDINSDLQRRALKVTSPRLLYILNELVRTDIEYAVRQTFPDYFDEQTEITMVDGTLEYDLPDDFDVSKSITDQDGHVILRGSNTPRDVDPKNKIKIYGNKLYVNEDASFTSLVVSYWKPFPMFISGEDILLPDNVTRALRNVWVTGTEFFFFSENKKTQETQTSYTRYSDAKGVIMAPSVSSFNL